MKLVIFGLTISSSWGNGHATLWRGLCRALDEQGHTVVFFERDVPDYARHRDGHEMPGDGELHLFETWDEVRPTARRHLADADVGMVTSCCHDGVAATELVVASPVALSVFYDLDTLVTLGRLQSNQRAEYVGPRGLRDFDLVLSATGGGALEALQEQLGARRVAPLYGSVDPEVHCPTAPTSHLRADLSHLDTYAQDRQDALETLFIEPARRLPKRCFLVGGTKHPEAFTGAENIYCIRHIEPSQHSTFYSSSRLTLNITRPARKEIGYCPSGRLFEAAACGAPILSDAWEGLDTFFEPGSEILVAETTEAAIAALQQSPDALARMAHRARARVLDEHTAAYRVREMEAAFQSALHAPNPTSDASLEEAQSLSRA